MSPEWNVRFCGFSKILLSYVDVRLMKSSELWQNGRVTTGHRLSPKGLSGNSSIIFIFSNSMQNIMLIFIRWVFVTGPFDPPTNPSSIRFVWWMYLRADLHVPSNYKISLAVFNSLYSVYQVRFFIVKIKFIFMCDCTYFHLFSEKWVWFRPFWRNNSIRWTPNNYGSEMSGHKCCIDHENYRALGENSICACFFVCS